LYFLDDFEAVLRRISHLLQNEILYQHDPIISLYDKTQGGEVAGYGLSTV
jgi:hypothetical protein